MKGPASAELNGIAVPQTTSDIAPDPQQVKGTDSLLFTVKSAVYLPTFIYSNHSSLECSIFSANVRSSCKAR